MYLKPETRTIFIEMGGLDKFISTFKASVNKRDGDNDFILARIGFLVSAQKALAVGRLVNEDRILADLATVFDSL